MLEARNHPSRERLLLALSLLVAAAAFLPGINWGLPSRAGDAYLFGSRPVWTGPQVQALVDIKTNKAWDDAARGADVDADPLAKSTDQLVPVAKDDGDRAEIVRRYRLFSHQPDEMITLMALAKMRPAQFDFDPKLYQYGGLWVYPVGMLLKAAAGARLIDLRGGAGGLTYYLDNPDAFGRFYVVARLYVVFWGMVGVWAIFSLVRQITGNTWAAAGAAVLFATMPVVVNMAHEAKPHLPGAVLTLLAVLAAAKYVETGRLAHAVAAGVLCGAAMSMVLSTLPAFAILLAMALLRRPMTWGDRARVAVFAGLVGLAAYGLFNPYVVYHLLRGGGALKSNLGNSTAFYSIGDLPAGVVNVVRLMSDGATPGLLGVGLFGTVVLAGRAYKRRGDQSAEEVRRRAHGLLLAVPAGLTLIQASLVAAGKPGEFGRFLLFTDLFLVVEAAVLAHSTWSVAVVKAGTTSLGALAWAKAAPLSIWALLFVSTFTWGGRYVLGFVRDAGPNTSRMAAAREIESFRIAGAKRLLLSAEPAPYSVPPVNLFEWPVVLVPKGKQAGGFAKPGDVWVEVYEGDTPIGWADKPVNVLRWP